MFVHAATKWVVVLWTAASATGGAWLYRTLERWGSKADKVVADVKKDLK